MGRAVIAAEPESAMGGVELVLASASSARSRMLRDAGVAFAVAPAMIDESAVTASMAAEGGGGAEVAAALAALKARRVSDHRPDALVIGADQVLVCDGRTFEKPATLAQARDDLRALRGRTHELMSAVCVVRDGQTLWQHLARARLAMRPFTETFLEAYLDAAGAGVIAAVGAYQVEGLGAQLFSKIEGDYFAVLGLPLLPLLDFLRGHGIVAA